MPKVLLSTNWYVIQITVQGTHPKKQNYQTSTLAEHLNADNHCNK